MQDEVKVSQAEGLTEVRDADHALQLMDEVDSLVRFCSVSMLDVDRYARGSWAFWSVCHWITRHRAQAERDTRGRMEPVAWMYSYVNRGASPQIFTQRMRESFGPNWTETPLYALPPAPEAGQ